MTMRVVAALVAVAFAGCAPVPEDSDAMPLAPDARGARCIDSPPPQPVAGTGQQANEFPDEFAVCLYETERTKLVLYLASLRAWSEQMYATYGCERGAP